MSCNIQRSYPAFVRDRKVALGGQSGEARVTCVVWSDNQTAFRVAAASTYSLGGQVFRKTRRVLTVARQDEFLC